MNRLTGIAVFALSSLFLAAGANAQSGSAGAASGASAASTGKNNTTVGRDTSPLNPENSLEIIKPPTPAEEKAFKAFNSFQKMSNEDLIRKSQAGEDFVKKYPSTEYTPFVYSFLTVAYIQQGAVDKAIASGERDLALNPKDLRTMAVLSQSLSRLVKDSSPDAPAQLSKAETYGRNAIAGVPTLEKPEKMTEDNFAAQKNQILNMAHSGIGLVYVHRQDYPKAIAELEQAVGIGPNDDPTNFYLLGVSNLNSQHYDKAKDAFEKCAAMKGQLQETCAGGAKQAASAK